MQNRYRRSLLIVTVLVGAAVGSATQALPQTFSEFPLPTAGSEPYGITAGPDGALWFTEFGTNKIGRIATTGAITEFQLNVGPADITPGPDGAQSLDRWACSRVASQTKSVRGLRWGNRQ